MFFFSIIFLGFVFFISTTFSLSCSSSPFSPFFVHLFLSSTLHFTPHFSFLVHPLPFSSYLVHVFFSFVIHIHFLFLFLLIHFLSRHFSSRCSSGGYVIASPCLTLPGRWDAQLTLSDGVVRRFELYLQHVFFVSKCILFCFFPALIFDALI